MNDVEVKRAEGVTAAEEHHCATAVTIDHAKTHEFITALEAGLDDVGHVAEHTLDRYRAEISHLIGFARSCMHPEHPSERVDQADGVK